MSERQELMKLAKVIEGLPDYGEEDLDAQLYFLKNGRKVFVESRVFLINVRHRQRLVKALRHYARKDDMPRIPPRRR